MSAILGVFGPGAPRDDAEVHALLRPMVRRGDGSMDIWRAAGAVLAVSRFEWEARATCSGGAGVVVDGDLVVAADAAIYYRAELRRALTACGVEAGPTASHLVLAAWRCWGAAAVRRLEGDFAFVLYDRATDTVVAARDFAGRRPLYYGERRETLIVASTIGAVRAHRDVPGDLNVTAVAEAAAGLFSASHETVFGAVCSVPAGWLLTRAGGHTGTTRYWSPPAVDATGASSFDDGAEELRELLVGAVSERMDTEGPTSVWLSGGWDSPAVFAAGEEHVRRAGGEALRPVSISYPPGDSGREDELIQSLLDWTGRATHWIDIGDIPFLVSPERAAAERDEPFVHVFEHWLRALLRGSRSTGTRVALDGGGGDQLFAASLLYLADLIRQGRVAEFRREWAAKGLRGSGSRTLFELVLHPLLPTWLRRVGQAVRPTRHWGGPCDPFVPDWIDGEFARRHGLVERARTFAPAPEASSLADAEFAFHLVHPTGTRLVCEVFSLGLEEGVEVRSPLYDARLVEFAARRPLAERTSGAETKRLLRHACAPWLPAEFLAPRKRRTGTTTSYAHEAMRRRHAALVGDVLQAPLLTELGIVRPDVLAARWNEYLNGVSRYELGLYLTFQTELWLRAQNAPHTRQVAEQAVVAAACA